MSLSETITFGTPCNLNIYFMKIYTMLTNLKLDLTGIKWVALLNWSTMTMIESCCRKFFDRPVTKSIQIVSHFHSGMGSGCNNLVGYWCFTLNLLHSKQWAKYSSTYFFMFGQKKSFMIMVIIFSYRGCPQYNCLCNSFITVSLISVVFGMFNLVLCSNNPHLFKLKSIFTWFF